jgi:riboflavin kinase/FMN adenylyltransferase
MELFQTSSPLPRRARGAAVAIGNFDGVHCGHQVLIGRAGEIARQGARPFGVVTFEPHPKALFRPDTPPFRLTPLPAKRRALAALGLDWLAVLTFDRPFSQRSAESFVTEMLGRDMGLSHVVVGRDFCFGHQRRGTPQMLMTLGAEAGFATTLVDPVLDPSGQPYSSSRIRRLLAEGKVDAAASLLGRPWEIEGTVEPGDRLGRKLGFPTVNVRLGDSVRPAFGVYAMRVDIGDSIWRDAVGYVGRRPTVADRRELAEAHIFDYAGDLYSRNVRIATIAAIRGDRQFNGLDELVRQMNEDAAVARRLLVDKGRSTEPQRRVGS